MLCCFFHSVVTYTLILLKMSLIIIYFSIEPNSFKMQFKMSPLFQLHNLSLLIFVWIMKQTQFSDCYNNFKKKKKKPRTETNQCWFIALHHVPVSQISVMSKIISAFKLITMIMIIKTSAHITRLVNKDISAAIILPRPISSLLPSQIIHLNQCLAL